jgi:hypothetical protein
MIKRFPQRQSRPRTGIPVMPDPCALYAIAAQRLNDLLLGQAAVVVDNPQLGRVEYNQPDIAQLQQYVNSLADQCAAASGDTTRLVRQPISFEACP